MAKVFGAPYPLEKHPLGLMHTVESLDAVKADLLMLLLTNPGERVMMSNYGTPLRQKMFNPNDSSTVAEVKQMIHNSITLWEPRISVKNIEVSSNIDKNKLNPQDTQENMDHILMITISFFEPTNINEIQKLKLEVPLNSTGA